MKIAYFKTNFKTNFIEENSAVFDERAIGLIKDVYLACLFPVE